jgi:hypothetical protein
MAPAGQYHLDKSHASLDFSIEAEFTGPPLSVAPESAH